MYKISIILPTFNVENYLERVLNSLLSQTIGFSNLQIIFVDDCSTDNSCKIIDEFSEKYENIISVHLNSNSGSAGKPRNEGMKYVFSDYILFLDPDDYLLDNACEVLYDRMMDSDADIVIGGYAKNKDWVVHWYSVSDNSESIISNPFKNPSLYLNPPGLATKLFKKELIVENNISFPEKIPAQDLVFVTNCFLNANTIVSLNDFIVYCYNSVRNNENDKSISNNVNINYLLKLLKAFNLTLDLLEMFNIDNRLITIYFVKHHIPFLVMQFNKLNSPLDGSYLFNSPAFLEFRNREFIINNEILDNFFKGFINNPHDVDLGIMDSTWRNMLNEFLQSNDIFENEYVFNHDNQKCCEEGSNFMQNNCHRILKKIIKKNNYLIDLNKFL